MAKIKEVCEKTGLSEKAIRLYMKEGLVTPETAEGIYRNSYSFSQKDIELLKDIAVLRNAGFGINDIRQMQQSPECLPAMIEEKQNLLEVEICEKKKLQNALERLSEPERGTVKNLAKSLENVVQHEEFTNPIKSKRIPYLVAAIGLSTILMLWMYVRYSAFLVAIVCSFLCGLVGIISIFMAFRYFTYGKRIRSLQNSSVGYIASVVQNGSINISFARAGGGSAGTKEPGSGGIWLLVMMFWNEIRPDNWYPVIQYIIDTDKDEIQAATFPYGAFKNTWQEGEKVEIVWNPDESNIVYPLETDWMKKKAWLYSIVGIGLVVFSIGLWKLLV